MKRKKILFRIFVVVIIFVTLAGVGTYFGLLAQLNPQKPVNTTLTDKLFGWKFPVAQFPIAGPDGKQIAYSNIRDPGGIPQGLPVRLKVPVIGVDSAIEDAQITPDGRMDVPAGTVNVAWFSLGPHPGKEGSAVIGGHYGNYQANKGPTVFFNLDKLKPGDKVYIVDDKGDTLAFQVQRIQLFDRNADATPVFTSSDGKAHLNLITCEGVWNKVNDSYPDRRVVFTDAISGEGAVTVTKVAPAATKKPTLPQTAIVKSTVSPIPTTSPSEAPTTSPAPTLNESSNLQSTNLFPEALSPYFKSLYGSIQDSLISSFLIFSIIFFSFKIIRR